MSLDMTDSIMGYLSFPRASTPANVSSNVWTNGMRKGKKALGSSRHFRPHHSVCQLLVLVDFPTLATVQLLCMLPQLVSASVPGQFGAKCAPSTAQGLLWRARGSWITSAATNGLICGRPGVQPAVPCQIRWKNANDWTARLIRL